MSFHMQLMHRSLRANRSILKIVARHKSALGHPVDQPIEIPQPLGDLLAKLARLLDGEL
jgi:hypothetical protein